MKKNPINNIQSNNEARAFIKKHLILFEMFMIIIAILLSAVSIISSANAIIRSNVYIMSALDLLISMFDIIIFAVCFSFIIYSQIKLSYFFVPLTIYIIGVILRHVLTAIVGGLIYRVISSSDIISASLSILLDAVIVLSVSLITFWQNKKEGFRPSKSQSKDSKTNKAKSLFPDMSQTLDRALFITSIILTLVKLLSRIVFDISYGLPTSLPQIMWMIIYYLSDLLICPVFYLISSFVVQYLNKKVNKGV